MRALPAGLQDHLDSSVTTMCWCWKLQTNDAQVFGFTDHDNDLDFDNTVFEAASGFSGSEIETGLGFAVDNLEVDGALSSLKLNEDELYAGVFDNAIVEIWHVNWSNTTQRILLRSGNLGQVSRGETNFSAEIRGLSHHLNQPRGRLFQKTCDAVLGNERCKVALQSSSFKFTATVGNVLSGKTLISNNLIEKESGWFDGGKLTFLSGQNAGRSSEVKSHRQTASGYNIQIWQTMPNPIQQGDEFEITAGCNKSYETCKAKFSNGVNFQGFPHMPGKDFITFYPNRDDAKNDGGLIVE